jgi:opacity protein-like surface antigen
MRVNNIRRRAPYVVGLALLSNVLSAQTGDLSYETSEVSSYVGVGSGISSVHTWIGGSTGVSPSKYFMAVLDTNFLPMGSHTLRTGLVGTSISRLYDFNFGGHILIPLHHRITPYGILAAGVLYNTYRISSIRPDGVTYLAGRSDCKFGFETGGGVRFFATEGFGVRGEYRFTASTQNFHRVLVGVFYEFGGIWPFRASNKRHSRLPR